ncbi:MAG: hypothetical protein U0031_23535 [Thermomicrobiales bacterium]
MRVTDISVTVADTHAALQGLVSGDRDADDAEGFAPFTLWYRYPRWCLPYLRADNGDPWLAALLYPAMRAAERLVIPVPVSRRLLEALPDIQAIYAAFDRRATPVAVEAMPRTAPLPTDTATSAQGLFFSLGVDSFYNLLANEQEHPGDGQTISHLIAIDGIDTAHDGWDEVFPSALFANLVRVAAERGKTLLPVSTNIRQEGQRLAPWPMHHGGALASVALALGMFLERVTIAASATYATLYPWGSHPLLDPLWSTESLTVIHDGCERDTIEKTRLIVRDPLVRETLRVCPWAGRGYNCGRCLKCLRTAIDLLQMGILADCPTLPQRIDPALLREVLDHGSGPVHLAAFRTRLARFEAVDGYEDLRDAIADYLRAQDHPPRRHASRPRRFWRRDKG